jgi:uncharacterized protein YciI
MPLFFFHCIDRTGQTRLREENRAAHIAYVRGFGERIRLAGPTLAEDGETMTGSVLIVELADANEAEDFTRNDPYRKAGLFEQVAVHPFRQVLPAD